MGLSRPKDLQELLASPVWMLTAQVQNLLAHIVWRPMRAGGRSSGTLLQSGIAILQESANPFLPGWPTDGVPFAEFDDREGSSKIVGNK